MVGKKKFALILSGILVVTGLMSCSRTKDNEGSMDEEEKVIDVKEIV